MTDYEALYEGLYQRAGYHKDARLTHGTPLLRELSECDRHHDLTSVLDVGCSHGMVVSELWKGNFIASGTDVADTAVERALALRKPPSKDWCVLGDCFRRGSATSLPWPDASFDAIISSDVLEHIDPADVPRVVLEFHRVARKRLLLLVSPHMEINQKSLRALRQNHSARESRLHKVLDRTVSLHVSVQSLAWWEHAFERGGFRVRPSGFVPNAYHLVLDRIPQVHSRRVGGGGGGVGSGGGWDGGRLSSPRDPRSTRNASRVREEMLRDERRFYGMCQQRGSSRPRACSVANNPHTRRVWPLQRWHRRQQQVQRAHSDASCVSAPMSTACARARAQCIMAARGCRA
jgi:SAM-dependent methyltransferase